MVLTAYFVLSPATNSSCHRHPRIKVLSKARSGRLASANLTPATGARTTRLCRPLKRRSSCTLADRSRGSSRPATACAPDALASTASRPAFVTIAKRPSVGTGRLGYASDLGQARTEIFLPKGLDRQSGKTRSDLPVRQICAHVQDGLSPSRNPSPSFQNMMGIAEFIIGRAFARPVAPPILRAPQSMTREAANEMALYSEARHARPCAGHPRLNKI